jgi:hypothetical protein
VSFRDDYGIPERHIQRCENCGVEVLHGRNFCRICSPHGLRIAMKRKGRYPARRLTEREDSPQCSQD